MTPDFLKELTVIINIMSYILSPVILPLYLWGILWDKSSTTDIFTHILRHMDLVLSSEMQHRPSWQNKTTFTIPISNMLGWTSIFQLEPRVSLTSAENRGCLNSRYTGADCNISSLPGRLASINRPIHQAGVLPLTRVSEADEGNKWWREGINQRKGGEAPAPWLV